MGCESRGLLVPDYLAELQRDRVDVPVNALPDDEAYLLVNGRWSHIHTAALQQINTALTDASGAVAMALLDRTRAEAFWSSGCVLPDGVAAETDATIDLITRPWQVIQQAHANLPGDIERIAAEPLSIDDPTVVITGGGAVYAEQGVKIGSHVVFETGGGAVLLAAGAKIESMTTLQGPCYVGPDSTVIRHGDIRANTVIGPVCKVGGEVSGTVVQGFSNKAHFGFVGDSYIGEWVNLGAGTTTSNLKNTYGDVSMAIDPGGEAEPTGMPFLGSVIGDHAKTAIGTRLTTGSCLRTGAMVAVSSFAPKFVARFAFLTDGQERRYELTKFVEVAERMMHRRGQTVSEALRSRLAELRLV